MPRFQHILFPVDSSDRCIAVRPFVTALAQRFHSRLTLINVVQIPSHWYGGFDAGIPVMIDLAELEQEARCELENFFDSSMFNGSMVDRMVVVGDPATEIIQFAAANDVDLIAMPTHGYGKFRRLLLGSVTAKVLHDARCPVWTATHTQDPELGKHVACRSIMATIDLASMTVPMLHYYAEVARDFNAKLRLVHAVPSADTDTTYPMDQDFRTFLMQSARQEIARLQREAGTQFEVCMEAGPVSKVVREAALHHSADLIVIGRGRLQETFGQLRTNAYAIIRDAPCPVLSI
jgi:nucleotide-binding universal stress UspA family protein